MSPSSPRGRLNAVAPTGAEATLTGAEGEGVLFPVLPKHCGLSFRLSHEVADTEHQQDWSAEDLRTLPQNSKVTQILVSGCQK